MVLDIANTGVARGKIYLARQKGEPIPRRLGDQRRRAGRRPIPQEAIDGHHPADGAAQGLRDRDDDGHALRRADRQRFGSGVHGPYQTEHRSGCGHLMIALDIAAFQPLAEFNARMEQLIAQIKSVPLAKGFDEVFYPGELEARNDAANRKAGLHLPDDTLADLAKIAKETGLESKLPF